MPRMAGGAMNLCSSVVWGFGIWFSGFRGFSIGALTIRIGLEA